MRKKIVIANWGVGEQGKSSSVKNVFALLNEKYPSNLLINNIMGILRLRFR